MAANDNGIRRRWRRRAIVLLVVVNTALWVFWSAGTSGRSHGRPHAAAAQVSHSPAASGR